MVDPQTIVVPVVVAVIGAALVLLPIVGLHWLVTRRFPSPKASVAAFIALASSFAAALLHLVAQWTATPSPEALASPDPAAAAVARSVNIVAAAFVVLALVWLAVWLWEVSGRPA